MQLKPFSHVVWSQLNNLVVWKAFCKNICIFSSIAFWHRQTNLPRSWHCHGVYFIWFLKTRIAKTKDKEYVGWFLRVNWVRKVPLKQLQLVEVQTCSGISPFLIFPPQFMFLSSYQLFQVSILYSSYCCSTIILLIKSGLWNVDRSSAVSCLVSHH